MCKFVEPDNLTGTGMLNDLPECLILPLAEARSSKIAVSEDCSLTGNKALLHLRKSLTVPPTRDLNFHHGYMYSFATARMSSEAFLLRGSKVPSSKRLRGIHT